MEAMGHERIHQYLYAVTRQAPGGLNQQAIAAIENALLDIKGQALNVPVYDLLGGAIRREIPVYWSHCGTYLMRPEIAELCGVEPLRTLEDLTKLGRRVYDAGFTGLKTNMITFDNEGKIGRYAPGFAVGAGWPDLNLPSGLIGE
jgi:galactonate dehydratase